VTRQLVILSNDSGSANGGLAELGTRKEVLRQLETCNTFPEVAGEDLLYGPGFRLEIAPGQDPITQMLLTIDDEDIAWVSIMRISTRLNWRLVDPMSGRELKPHAGS
jgi:hypothetical protein